MGRTTGVRHVYTRLDGEEHARVSTPQVTVTDVQKRKSTTKQRGELGVRRARPVGRD